MKKEKKTSKRKCNEYEMRCSIFGPTNKQGTTKKLAFILFTLKSVPIHSNLRGETYLTRKTIISEMDGLRFVIWLIKSTQRTALCAVSVLTLLGISKRTSSSPRRKRFCGDPISPPSASRFMATNLERKQRMLI